MTTYRYASVPAFSEHITFSDGELSVPNTPIIPFIEGDGVGPEIWGTAVRVIDAAVERSYGGERRIAWMELLAGERAHAKAGQWMPAETLEAIREFRVAIKGPLTTPYGGGQRSLNSILRQQLDLYACIRTVRYFKGLKTSVPQSERLNAVFFRENTVDARTDLPMTKFESQRLVQLAIRYALMHGRESVTLVHRNSLENDGESSFCEWGFEVAREKFGAHVVPETDLVSAGAHAKADAVVLKNRIADEMFEQLLTRPSEYSVVVTSSINGDYFSDAAIAQVGGLGMAPSANLGDGVALFEATHGTALKYAGLNRINPCGIILSGVMMLDFMQWPEAGNLIVRGIERAIAAGQVTRDLVRHIADAKELTTSAFGDAIIAGMTR